jgi:DNA-directed RNA polymerase specialized sigma24 family protein/ribosome-associated translation inhibitor RaiA
MQVQWTFDGCASKTKGRCRDYWEKKHERLERLLSSIPADSKKLRIRVYCYPDQVNRFEARGVLNLPGRALAVQFSNLELFTVLDGLSDKLVSAAKKYKEQSVHFVRQKRRLQSSDDLIAAQPLLTWDEKAERKESFFSILRPLLGFLERYARSEIKVYELEGLLSPGRVEVADVVNEVVLLAWEKFHEKPKDLSLEFWLIRLLQEVFGRIEWEGQFVSLDQNFPLADIDYTAEPDWFEEMLGYQEEFTLAELVPDYDETEEWEQLDDVERNLHFYTVLQKIPSYQRQAYLLHALDEYSLEDVSKIQDRNGEEIEKDIMKSRKAMKDYMYETGMVYKRKQERSTL